MHQHHAGYPRRKEPGWRDDCGQNAGAPLGAKLSTNFEIRPWLMEGSTIPGPEAVRQLAPPSQPSTRPSWMTPAQTATLRSTWESCCTCRATRGWPSTRSAWPTLSLLGALRAGWRATWSGMSRCPGPAGPQGHHVRHEPLLLGRLCAVQRGPQPAASAAHEGDSRGIRTPAEATDEDLARMRKAEETASARTTSQETQRPLNNGQGPSLITGRLRSAADGAQAAADLVGAGGLAAVQAFRSQLPQDAAERMNALPRPAPSGRGGPARAVILL